MNVAEPQCARYDDTVKIPVKRGPHLKSERKIHFARTVNHVFHGVGRFESGHHRGQVY